MKRHNRKWAALAAGALTSATFVNGVTAQTSDPALNALVKKGILTEQEAKAALAEQEAAEKGKKDSDNKIDVFWKHGINFKTGNGVFKGKLGGRLQWDVAGFSADDDLKALLGDDLPVATEARRARIGVEGTVTTSTPILYKLEVDFATDGTVFKDVYLGMDKIPYAGKFRAGHFKEPMGLEMLASSRFLQFMERSLPSEAFAPERNIGGMFNNTLLDKRMTWAAGVFTETDSEGRSSELDSNYRVTGRVTGTPWYDEEAQGARLLHLGVSGTYVDPGSDSARFRSRPEAHLAPRFADTGSGSLPGSDHSEILGLESALVFDSYSLQGEYFRSWTSSSVGSPSYYGFYLTGSWFITGEHRNYSTSKGAFGRLVPNESFSITDGGWGAWQLALRYSHLDLNDEGINGGRLNNITCGLNWHLNGNAKIQFNYVNSCVDRSSIDETAHIFQSRFAMDF